MRIVEILLPKTISHRDLPAKTASRIDMLQNRMSSYVDKICDPATSAQGKEFLKSRLRNDYHELKQHIHHIHHIAENELPVAPTKYEVYDRQTGKRVSGPYSTRSRARGVVDKKDNEYGGYRYGIRPAVALTEAVHKVPLTPDDFDLLKKLMERPIPAAIAPMYIHDIIIDDALNDEFRILEDSEPNRDVRPMIAEWVARIMPDQLYRFDDNRIDKTERNGIMSVIHGYDPHQYSGQSMEVTGNNAFGRS